VRIEFHAGHKADERPTRLWLGQHCFEIVEVEDRWYSPGETYFRVRVASGERYVLRRIDGNETWHLEAYRAG
jgi:hypothetical protein